MIPRSAILACATATLAAACNPYPRIVCTPEVIRACFGFDQSLRSLGGDSTLITIRIQNLQGTILRDSSAWSQLLYIRVFRNMAPSLGFPEGGPVIPTWDPGVQTIGPEPKGSGWHNGGTNFPSFVSEWAAVGGQYGKNVGYVAGRARTYNEVVGAGAGLRTYKAPGKRPGWVTFTFVAKRPVTAADIHIEIAAWASLQPASSLPVPENVGCQVIQGGGTAAHGCIDLPYDLH